MLSAFFIFRCFTSKSKPLQYIFAVWGFAEKHSINFLKQTFQEKATEIIHWLHLKRYSWFVTAWKVAKYRVISGPYFPAFGLNTERYSISGIQSECGNTRNNSVFGHVRHVSIKWALPLVRLIQLKFLLCRGFCYVNRLRLFILILSYCCTLKL